MSKALKNKTKLNDVVDVVADFGADPTGVADSTSAIQNAVTAATGKQLVFPAGTYKVSSTINLPTDIRITGLGARGMGVYSVTLSAAFAGPVLQYSAGGNTAIDIVLEYFSVIGNLNTYGAGNGITINNGQGGHIHNVVVAGFGTNQINLTGTTNSLVCRDVYCSEGGYGPGTANAGFYSTGTYNIFDNCNTDDCKYGIYIDTGGSGNVVSGGVIEGATVAQIFVGNISSVGKVSVHDVRINCTRGFKGIVCDGLYTTIANNFIFGNTGTYGIDITANGYGAVLNGNTVLGFATAARVNTSGFNRIVGNYLSGTTTGLEIPAVSLYLTLVEGNDLSGVTNSVLHTSTNLVTYIGNRYDNTSGTYKAPTVTAGQPSADFPVPWTPAVAGAAVTVNSAQYTKIGQQVTVQFDLTWPATADATAVKITGMPFNVLNTIWTAGSIGYCGQPLVTNLASIDATHLQLFSAGGGNITNAQMSGQRIWGSISYFSAS